MNIYKKEKSNFNIIKFKVLVYLIYGKFWFQGL